MTTRAQLQRLIELIPKDPLRPHANFPATLLARLDSSSSSSPHASTESSQPVAFSASPSTPPASLLPSALKSTPSPPTTPPRPFSNTEMTSLARFAQNTHKLTYVLSDRTLRPAFNPGYYVKLADAMRGDQRPGKWTWLTRYFRWS